jgi:hypothetical protein
VVLLDDDGGGFGETEGGIFTPYSNVEVWETGLGFIGAGGIVYNDVLGGVTDFVFTPENAWSPIIMDDIVLVVPEPATVMLLLGIGLPILLRRRREK